MFLPDTNIVSELLRPSPDPAVETWIGDRQATDLYFPAIGEAELRYGVAVLPAGGLPDRGDRAFARDGRGDAQRPGLREHRHRGHRPLGGGMSGAAEAFARVGTGASSKDAG